MRFSRMIQAVVRYGRSAAAPGSRGSRATSSRTTIRSPRASSSGIYGEHQSFFLICFKADLMKRPKARSLARFSTYDNLWYSDSRRIFR